MKRRYLSVTETNNYIYRLIKSDPIIQSIYVQGEISNFRKSPKGYIFFSLKDKDSKIDCVIFNGLNIDFELKDGMQVEIMGNVDFYQRDGSIKLKVYYAKEVGIGIAFKNYLDLARKLENEGLLDIKYKKAITKIPTTIGVITSPTGSVLQDIINVRNNRHPQCNLIVYPTMVQGVGTAENVRKGIIYFNENEVNTIIIARGGGSYEDLAEFNDEELAREVFRSNIPIISAIGHETDTTILDLIADKRASTPSNAGEIALPSNIELMNEIHSYMKKAQYLVKVNWENNVNELKDKRRLLDAYSPQRNFRSKLYNLENLLEQIQAEINFKLKEEILHVNGIGRSLILLNPLLPYEKGFTIVKKGENIITKGSMLKTNDEVNLEFVDKKVTAKIL